MTPRPNERAAEFFACLSAQGASRDALLPPLRVQDLGYKSCTVEI